jgi:hypothetical protein
MLNPVKKSQDLYKNKPWLTFLVLVTLGTMVLAVCSLLLGCGSDSTPASGVKGKHASTATKSGIVKSQAVTQLLPNQEAAGPGKKGLVKKPPDAKTIEVFPGVTAEQVEAKLAANRAKRPTEVFPGVTAEEVEAKLAANRAKRPTEVFPGVTAEQVEAKLAANRAKRPTEVFPGVTAEQVEAKLAANRAKRPTNVFPGLIQPGTIPVGDGKEKAVGQK